MEQLLYLLIEFNIVFIFVGLGLWLIRSFLNPSTKRLSILLTPVISIIIVLFKKGVSSSSYALPQVIELDPVTVTNNLNHVPLASASSQLFYLLIAIPPICAIIYRLIKPVSAIIRTKFKQKGDLKVSIKGSISYSFFNWIIIEEGLSKEETDLVIHHESLHSKLGHTFDCIIYELFSILFWINPVYHLLRKEMKLNHEYQVDQILFERYENNYINLLLNHTFGTSSISYLLTNQFMDASKLKKRILEMKTKRKQKLAWLLVVPMLGLAGTTVSFVNPEKTVESGISKLDDSIVKASFKGGMDQYIAYFIKEVKYPETAKKQNLSGKVFVEFTVKKDGSISDSKIQKSTNEIFNKEALRVVNAMPKWNPATKEGKAVNSKMVVPIQFKL